jgi:hypothetical protein
LFRVSPDSPFHPEELHLRGEYFPIGARLSPGKPSEENKSLVVSTCDNKATARKPVLLLVEDNYINLKVCLDREDFREFLPPGITSIRTNSAKLLETFTKKNNYEYDTAENGLLALQAFQNARDRFDIIFMGKQILFLNVAAF